MRDAPERSPFERLSKRVDFGEEKIKALEERAEYATMRMNATAGRLEKLEKQSGNPWELLRAWQHSVEDRLEGIEACRARLIALEKLEGLPNQVNECDCGQEAAKMKGDLALKHNQLVRLRVEISKLNQLAMDM